VPEIIDNKLLVAGIQGAALQRTDMLIVSRLLPGDASADWRTVDFLRLGIASIADGDCGETARCSQGQKPAA
jgi:hypothetical protein